MPAVPPELNAYADAHTTPEPDYLSALADETRATQATPEMLTSPAAARLLEMLVFALGAQRVLEIGTYTGHSALAMAAGLPAGGRIVTCELDPDRAQFARRHIEAAGFGDRIEIRVGPALETVASLDGPFDLVFIDADKGGYPGYVDATLPKLAERGLIVLDNTLMGGESLDPGAGGDTAVMQELNRRLAADSSLVVTLLTVRDGMTLIRKR